jgi:leader peptidase (prepilin peptidase)/N-methyltransferase
MIIAVLAILGLCLGSFVNALVWRLHEQSKGKKGLSITRGRSMCPHCRHELAPADLIPVLSWLSLGGKCRYCRKPISVQYPLVELVTAGLFAASYLWWPQPPRGWQTVNFGLWLAVLAGLVALTVYDLRWKLLPDRIIYPLSGLAGAMALISVATSDRPFTALLNVIAAVAVGGGLFYALFQLSNGKWIGGGDVKLGWLLGLIVGTPARSLLFIFAASLGGSLVSLPLLAGGKLKRDSVVPFGPFLILGAVVTQLFGADILHWYRQTFIMF